MKLIKADGKHIEVPLAKLSDNDATYAREQAKKVDENPFKEAPASDEPGNSDHADETPETPAKKGIWKGVKLVKPQTFKAWTFKPSVAAPAAGGVPPPK